MKSSKATKSNQTQKHKSGIINLAESLQKWRFITDHQLNLNCHHHAAHTGLILLRDALAGALHSEEMNILLHTELRSLSWNIATRFVHVTKKYGEYLEMVQEINKNHKKNMIYGESLKQLG